MTGRMFCWSGLSDIAVTRPAQASNSRSSIARSPGSVGQAAPPQAMKGPSRCRPGILAAWMDGIAATISRRRAQELGNPGSEDAVVYPLHARLVEAVRSFQRRHGLAADGRVRTARELGLRVLPPAQPAFIWYPYGGSKEFPQVNAEVRGVPRGGVAALDLATGALLPWNPAGGRRTLRPARSETPEAAGRFRQP